MKTAKKSLVISVTDFARLLGVSKPTAVKIAHANFQVFKLTDTYNAPLFIKRAEVEEWIEEGLVKVKKPKVKKKPLPPSPSELNPLEILEAVNDVAENADGKPRRITKAKDLPTAILITTEKADKTPESSTLFLKNKLTGRAAYVASEKRKRRVKGLVKPTKADNTESAPKPDSVVVVEKTADPRPSPQAIIAAADNAYDSWQAELKQAKDGKKEN